MAGVAGAVDAICASETSGLAVGEDDGLPVLALLTATASGLLSSSELRFMPVCRVSSSTVLLLGEAGDGA